MSQERRRLSDLPSLHYKVFERVERDNWGKGGGFSKYLDAEFFAAISLLII